MREQTADLGLFEKHVKYLFDALQGALEKVINCKLEF
jgi:hypothetical protein